MWRPRTPVWLLQLVALTASTPLGLPGREVLLEVLRRESSLRDAQRDVVEIVFACTGDANDVVLISRMRGRSGHEGLSAAAPLWVGGLGTRAVAITILARSRCTHAENTRFTHSCRVRRACSSPERVVRSASGADVPTEAACRRRGQCRRANRKLQRAHPVARTSPGAAASRS